MNHTTARALTRSLHHSNTRLARPKRPLSTSSTPTTPTTPTPTSPRSHPHPKASHPPPPPPPPSRPSFLRRRRRAIIWSTLGLSLGSTLGFLVAHTIAPPPHPTPGSHEDELLMADLEARIDAEFKTKVLRGRCTAAGRGLRGEEGEWVELPGSVSNMAGSGRKQEGNEEANTLINTTLSGSSRLGPSRIFHNTKTHELVAVVWFGGATSGWPGVAHGGCIATVLEEKMAQAAHLAVSPFSTTSSSSSPSSPSSSTSSGVTGRAEGLAAATARATAPSPKRISIDYKKPTYANAFYVVRMQPHTDSPHSSPHDEVEVEGTLETLDGRLCVAVSGTVSTGGVDEAGLGLGVVKKARGWIGWPSRSGVIEG